MMTVRALRRLLQRLEAAGYADLNLVATGASEQEIDVAICKVVDEEMLGAQMRHVELGAIGPGMRLVFDPAQS